MNIKSTIDLSWDIDWIFAQVREGGAVNHTGWQETDEGYDLYYRGEHFDLVQGIIDEYPIRYLNEVLRPQLKDAVTAIRWEKQQVADFNGMPLPADDPTVARITAAAYLMDADPASPQTRRWKAATDVWLTVDRPTLVAMGTTIANHMQACFDREEALHNELNAAASIDEIKAIDITSGWPGD